MVPNRPPYTEVEALLLTMSNKCLTPQERIEHLQTALQLKIRSIIEIMRICAKENPDFKLVIDAISNPSIDANTISQQTFDYPVALELCAALEKGLANSSHSSVQATTISDYIEAIDRAQLEQCSEG